MNPKTNKFEKLLEQHEMLKIIEEKIENMKQSEKTELSQTKLSHPNKESAPEHCSIFTIGEDIVIKNYVFKIAYIGETSILLEPKKPWINETKKKYREKIRQLLKKEFPVMSDGDYASIRGFMFKILDEVMSAAAFPNKDCGSCGGYKCPNCIIK